MSEKSSVMGWTVLLLLLLVLVVRPKTLVLEPVRGKVVADVVVEADVDGDRSPVTEYPAEEN